jgi:hypothetical protein
MSGKVTSQHLGVDAELLQLCIQVGATRNGQLPPFRQWTQSAASSYHARRVLNWRDWLSQMGVQGGEGDKLLAESGDRLKQAIMARRQRYT